MLTVTELGGANSKSCLPAQYLFHRLHSFMFFSTSSEFLSLPVVALVEASLLAVAGSENGSRTGASAEARILTSASACRNSDGGVRTSSILSGSSRASNSRLNLDVHNSERDSHPVSFPCCCLLRPVARAFSRHTDVSRTTRLKI